MSNQFRFVYLVAINFIIIVVLGASGKTALLASETDPAAQTIPSLSFLNITEPDGANDRIAERNDFATTILGNPWDMNQATDVRPSGPMNNPGHGFQNVTFAGGAFQGTTLSHDSYLWLHHQGYPLANNLELYNGLANPIDANQYRLLAFRLYREDGDPNVPIRVYWYKAGDEVTGQPSGTSVAIPAQAGWNVYILDLGIASNVARGSWSGQVTGLRIDPTSTSNTGYTGKLIRLDWVRLMTAAATGPQNSYTIQWNSDLGAGNKAILSLSLDHDNNPNNGVIQTIDGGMVNQSNGSYTLTGPVLPPGNYYIHARLGSDYAGVVKGNPWDFSQSSDYTRLENFSSPSISDGIFSGTSTNSDPQIWMSIDADKPVDTSIYTKLIIRINVSTRTPLMFLWTKQGEELAPWQGSTSFFNVDPGWRTVVIDLTNSANIASGQWSGKISNLRFDPGTAANARYQIDYIGLTSGADINAEAELTPVQATSPGVLTINQAPILHLVAPSMTSGDDYATTMLGNPWDFADASDLMRTAELASISYSPNRLSFTTQELHTACPDDCGDPQLWLNVSPDPEKFIDTARFKYMTVRYWVEGVQDVFAGWAMRVLWSPRIFPNDYSVSDDIIPLDAWPTYTEENGWHTVQWVMSELLTEHEDAGASNWGWNNSKGKIAFFRFDPIEMPPSMTMHLGQIFLTADPVAVGDYTIQWTIENPDDNAAISAYYSPQKTNQGRTLIGSVNQPNNSIVWDTSNVTPGTYYIYIEANDGFNVNGKYSDVPVIVRKQTSIAVQDPADNGSWLERGDEFSEDVFGNAWDMDSAADIDSQVMVDLTSTAFNNGEFSFRSSGVDSHFWLSWDNAKPIDANTYSKFCFHMYSSEATQWELYWYNQNEQAFSSGLQLVLPGWNTYVLDMKQFSNWNGSIKRLRIDPLFATGIDAKLDWVKLAKPNSATYEVGWTTANAEGSTVSLYASRTQSTADSTLLAQNIAPTSTPYTVDLSCLPTNDYYLYGELGDGTTEPVRSFSPGKVSVVEKASIPQLISSSKTLNFLMEPGQQQSRLVSLRTSFGSGFNWDLSPQSKPWLSVTPTSGSLPDELMITANSSQLSIGQIDSTVVTVNVPNIGTIEIQVRIQVVDQVYDTYLPSIHLR